MKRIIYILGLIAVGFACYFCGKVGQAADIQSEEKYKAYFEVTEELLDSINSINPQVYDSLWLQAGDNDTLMGRYDACCNAIKNME